MFGGLLKIVKMNAARAKISRSGSPTLLFKARYYLNTFKLRERDMYIMSFLGGKEGTDGSAAEGGCWSWRRTTGKSRHGRTLDGRRPTM
jgi:hypothetical protein